jgi:hypothetical protein
MPAFPAHHLGGHVLDAIPEGFLERTAELLRDIPDPDQDFIVAHVFRKVEFRRAEN